MISDSVINNVVRFKDGSFLGLFGKVYRLADAIQFNGDWQTEIHLKNNPIRLSEEQYEIKVIRTDYILLD